MKQSKIVESIKEGEVKTTTLSSDLTCVMLEYVLTASDQTYSGLVTLISNPTHKTLMVMFIMKSLIA